VFWTVDALVYAEESGITKSKSNSMPIVNLFGKGFSRMLRDAIGTVGNYGEIYSRNLEPSIPREGLNRLVQDNTTGPLYLSFPGIFQ